MIFSDKLKEAIIFKRRVSLLLLGFSLILLATMWAYVILSKRPEQDLVPLHYNIYFGIDLFAEWYKIYLLPITGTAVLLFNTAFALLLAAKSFYVTTMMLVVSNIVQIILLASVYLIISQIYY